MVFLPPALFLLLVVETARLTDEPRRHRGELDRVLRGSSAHEPSPPQPGAGPEPGDVAAAFTVPTLDGTFSYKPGALHGSLVIHAFTNKSGFLECLWSSESSRSSLLEGLPDSSQVLVLSLDESAAAEVRWMREQLQRAAIPRKKEVLTRLHFSPVPLFALGNWIPGVFYYWGCRGRNCGLSQAVFTSDGWKTPVVVKRLDARYDWLTGHWSPNPSRLVPAGDGCRPSASVGGAVAWVSEGGCSFFTKVRSRCRVSCRTSDPDGL